MDKPIKVLLVSNVYPVNDHTGTPSIGIQQRLLELKGVQFDVLPITTGSMAAYFRAGIKFFLMNFQRPAYDLIHAYYGLSVFLALLQRKIPVVGTFLGSDLINKSNSSDRDRTLGKVAAKFADQVIVMSEEMKLASGRADAKVIPFGVDTTEFHSVGQQEAREQLGLHPKRKFVLFPWNPARSVKRFDIIEECMQILKSTDPEIALVVIFDRPHTEVMLYMNACDVMVLASDHEGSPVAVREALACGLPVVSVDVGDVKNLLGTGSNGVIVERDPAAFAEAIIRVINQGIEKVSETTKELYTNLDASESVLAVYLELLGQK